MSFITHSRTKLLAAFLASIVPSLHANAQGGSSSTAYSIGANAGLAIPVSDLSSFTSSGYTVGITLGMHQALAPLSFRLEGNFTELPWSGGNSSTKHRIYGFALDGLYNLGTVSTNGGLYLTGGVGYYGWKDTGTLFGDTQTTWDFGINAGLGYYLPLSGFTMYFEGRYTNVFSDVHQALFPITVGITF